MIKFITSDEVLPVRSVILRNGKQLEECVFPTDNIENAFHLGYFLDDNLVSVVSFHPQNSTLFGDEAVGYQLRGMGTLAPYQGKGIGNQLVNFAIVYLRGKKVNYIWCNARQKAYRFYQDLGFEFISNEFEISGIGPHKTMYLKILNTRPNGVHPGELDT